MKIQFLFGENVCTLPAKAAEAAARAEGLAMQVLLALAAEPALRTSAELSALLAARFGVSEGQINAAVGFWQTEGVLAAEGLPEAKAAPVSVGIAEPPAYTSAELAEKLEAENGKLRTYTEECQVILGRMFNPAEQEKMLCLVDWYGLSEAFVMLVCQYCRTVGKHTVGYVVKMATGLLADGIDDLEKLEAHLHKRELSRTLEGRVRTLCGIGGRALTKKEQACISAWTDAAYPMELIAHAYEITVDNTKGVSFAYMDKILQNWRNAGYRTLLEVEAATAARREQKDGTATGSFNTQSFFEAALKRSYAQLEE